MSTTSIPTATRSMALAIAFGLGFVFVAPAQAAGHGTEAWRDFARRSMMPDYAWNEAPAAKQLAPSLRDRAMLSRGVRGHESQLISNRGALHRSLSLAVGRGFGAGVEHSNLSPVQAPDLTVRLSPLHNQMFDASYEQDLGTRGRFGVSALVARQQYATPGFGLLGAIGASVQSSGQVVAQSEVVHGQGLRLDYRLPMTENLAWRASAQSRLDMRALESVHGVFAEPGDFDLPARLGAQVEWQASSNLALMFGVERVYYGEITPFTSPSLPTQLLSLMADGSAPAFAWNDLTVYSLEGQVEDRWHGQWVMRYSTRQQPSASAELYRHVLESEYTNTNVTLGYQRTVSNVGVLRLTASYAPSMAFLGPGTAFSSRTYAQGATTEFEAAWVMAF